MKPTISPEIEAEFLRMPDAAKFSGISRTGLYRLIADGRLKSKCIRQPGLLTGIRLISKQAIRDFIESCEEVMEPSPLRGTKRKSKAEGGLAK